jgi:hypothetical protein
MSDYIVSFDPAIINTGNCTVNIHTKKKNTKLGGGGKFSIKDSTNEGCVC